MGVFKISGGCLREILMSVPEIFDRCPGVIWWVYWR